MQRSELFLTLPSFCLRRTGLPQLLSRPQLRHWYHLHLQTLIAPHSTVLTTMSYLTSILPYRSSWSDTPLHACLLVTTLSTTTPQAFALPATGFQVSDPLRPQFRHPKLRKQRLSAASRMSLVCKVYMHSLIEISSFELLELGYGGRRWHCATSFNPLPSTTGPLSAASTALVTQWTVTAQYASFTMSTSTFSTAVVMLDTVITTIAITSYTYVGTSSQLFSIVTGGDEALVVAPSIQIRFQSTDEFAVSWFNDQTISGYSQPRNTTTAPLPRAPQKSGISGGAIAGIAIGGLVILGLVIGGLVFCLRRRRRITQSELPAHENMAGDRMTQ